MNMIVEGRRPISSGRTRVFACDFVAMARIQQVIDHIIGDAEFQPSHLASLTKFAIDASELAKTGVPTDWMLAAVAIGAEADDASGEIEYSGLYALDLEKRSMAQARSI